MWCLLKKAHTAIVVILLLPSCFLSDRCRAAPTIITVEMLTTIQQSQRGIMTAVLQDGTCYTNINMICVIDASALAPNGSEFQIFGIDPIYNTRRGDNIFVSNNAVTAHRSVDYKVAVVGESLDTVVEECMRDGKLVEAYTRIVNAFESAAFTIVARFCELSKALILGDRNDLMVQVSETFHAFVNVTVRNKFTDFGIAYNPLGRVMAAIGVVVVEDLARPRRIIFYNDVCREFSDRFGTMFGFVNVAAYDKTVDPDDPEAAHRELVSNMEEAQRLFISYQGVYF